MPAEPPLAAAIRGGLLELADPERAVGMQAYMKSDQPYLGVRLPEVRRVTRLALKNHPPHDVDDLRRTATVLWRKATFREERYAALAMTGSPLAAADLCLLPLYEEMIVTGAWWDHVDGVAHRVCGLLVAHRELMTARIRTWSTSSDRWLRRSAIIAQLGAKHQTDVALLAEVVIVNAGDREFFVRKAIGWALRDYAYTDPHWVAGFLDQQELSPLSRREAGKHLTQLLTRSE